MNYVGTILHPTDFSPHAQNAFELACGMAAQHGASVVLLHVAAPPPIAAPMPYDAATVQAGEFSEEEVRAKLERLRSVKPHLTMDYVLERGKPSEVILRVAKEANCDAVVMGTHGRTGLTRLLMGSVAEDVVRKAPCPVITVKEPMPEQGEAAPAPEAATANTL